MSALVHSGTLGEAFGSDLGASRGEPISVDFRARTQDFEISKMLNISIIIEMPPGDFFVRVW